jgi:hypothetical protein
MSSNAVRLWTFLSLNDVEDYFFAFFEAFITPFLNRTEMNEYIIATIPPKETIAFDIVKPLHYALILSHRVHLFMEYQIVTQLIVIRE